MGKAWDSRGVSFLPETWRIIRESCKPGAPLLSFGGTRTFHRIAVAIEDAGWEIRDTLMWVYGSGFPKSLDISKAIDKAAGEYVKGEVLPSSRTTGASGTGIATTFREKTATNPQTLEAKLWDGWGTGLKPSFEPIILAMNPLDGTFANNALKHGVAGLNIDECRVEGKYKWRASDSKVEGSIFKDGSFGDKPHPAGRFPSNLIHNGSDEVLALFPQTKSGNWRGYKPKSPRGFAGQKIGQPIFWNGDSGSAARFFYCAKASRSERGEGCVHPTVKPLALMTYLCKLVKMPEYNLILDPFCGSGTTLLACRKLGIPCIGIDSDEKSCEIAAKRLSQSVMRLE